MPGYQAPVRLPQDPLSGPDEERRADHHLVCAGESASSPLSIVSVDGKEAFVSRQRQGFYPGSGTQSERMGPGEAQLGRFPPFRDGSDELNAWV